MLDLLVAIERRAKYLDSALPKPKLRTSQAEPTTRVELPDESWAEVFQGLRIPALAIPNLEKTYGAEATDRGESAVITMLRNAAKGATPRLDAEIEIELMRLSDCGEAITQQFLHDHFEAETLSHYEREATR